MLYFDSLRRLVSEPASGVYKLAVVAYRFGCPGVSGLLFRRYLRFTGQDDLIAARSTNGCPNHADYDTFERDFAAFLERRWADWAAGRLPLPDYLAAQASPARREVLQGLTAFVVMPRYVQSNERYLEYDLIDHTYRALLNSGVETQMFDADSISYPALFKLDAQRARADLAALRNAVDEMHPKVLLFDGNFVGQSGSLDAACLAELKAKHGFKLIAFIGDAWGYYGRRAVEYWAPVSDLIIHLVPDLALEQQRGVADKLLCIPYPVNEHNFHPQPEHSLDLSFFGSRQTYLRLFWLAQVRTGIRRLGLRDNIHASLRTNDCPTMPEYAAIMRESRIVLNFSTRDRAHKIITGRVWQALHCGASLLEEENEPTKHFFVPFIHYVPFENARQLVHMIEFFSRNEASAKRIGETAARFCAERYAAADIWATIFARVFSSAVV